MEEASIDIILDMVSVLEKAGFTEIWLGYKDWISAKDGLRAIDGFEKCSNSVVVRPKIRNTDFDVHSIVHSRLGPSCANGWQVFGKKNIPKYLRGYYQGPNIKTQILIKELDPNVKTK